MRFCLLLLLSVSIASPLLARDTAQPPHRSCMGCHLAARVSAETEGTGQARHQFSYLVCASCHDGQIAEEPNLPLHRAHAGSADKPGLKCIVCHDPHTRTDSYRLLRGKRGPET